MGSAPQASAGAVSSPLRRSSARRSLLSDNDAGVPVTYSQAGQNYGNSLLWVSPF